MTIRASAPQLVLDLGGVIVDHDNRLMYDALRGLLDKQPTDGELQATIKASGISLGHTDAAGLLQRLAQAYGSHATLADFLNAWSCHFTLKHDMFAFLDSYRHQAPLVLCSNTNAAHWDHILAHFDIGRLTEKATLSHLVGCEKPDAAIYLHAAASVGRAPQECLFVDDLQANVDGALRLGFQGHQFTDLAHFRSAAGL